MKLEKMQMFFGCWEVVEQDGTGCVVKVIKFKRILDCFGWN